MKGIFIIKSRIDGNGEYFFVIKDTNCKILYIPPYSKGMFRNDSSFQFQKNSRDLITAVYRCTAIEIENRSVPCKRCELLIWHSQSGKFSYFPCQWKSIEEDV